MLLALAEIFSENVRHHPHWATAAGFVAMCMIVIPFAYPFLSKPPRGEINNSNTAGRDAAIQANGPVAIGDEAIKRLFPPVSASPQIVAPLPVLEFLAGDSKPIGFFNKSKWKPYPRGTYAALAWIENRTPGAATKIVASISTSNADEETVFVSRAYWLDWFAESITFQVGERQAIILGKNREGGWTCYENQPKQPRRQPYSGATIGDPSGSAISSTSLITATVTLYSEQTGGVLGRASYLIYPDNDSESLKVIKQ